MGHFWNFLDRILPSESSCPYSSTLSTEVMQHSSHSACIMAQVTSVTMKLVDISTTPTLLPRYATVEAETNHVF